MWCLWRMIVFLGALCFASCKRTCGSIGAQYNSDLLEWDGRFVLGTSDAATCEGTLSGFRYCFMLTQEPKEASVAVYRPMENGYYIKVSDAITLSYKNQGKVNGSLTCVNMSTEASISITEGDVIGLCVLDYSATLGIFVGLENSANHVVRTCEDGDLPQPILYEEKNDRISVLGIISSEEAESTGVLLSLFADSILSTNVSSGKDTPHGVKDLFFSEGKVTTLAIALFVVLGIVVLVVILIFCICCICVWRYAKRRRRLRYLSMQHHGKVQADCADDLQDFYVNYGTQHPNASNSSKQSTHIIGPENLSTSGDYCAVNPMLNVVKNLGDSGIVSSNSEFTSTSDFHGVDGTRVHYTDIQSMPSLNTSHPSNTEDRLHGCLENQSVNVLMRSKILVESDNADDFSNIAIWQRDNNDQVPIFLKKSDEDNRVELLQEAAILSQLKHTNIINFYGILKDDICVTIVVDDLPYTLKSYMENLRMKSGSKVPRGTSKLLLTFSQQVALGMKYITDKGFVHGNLKASNVMMSSDNECKITNFSMCHDIDHGRGDKLRHMITVKWNAPEVLENSQFSTASDVWSFASLLYEIWSVGRDPFEGESNINVIGLIHQGRRLSPPSGCPRAIYEIMIQCWNPSVFERPSFSEVLMDLTRPDIVLLHIPQELVDLHPKCAQLGQPMSIGKLMYQDLQVAYCTRYRQ